MSLNYKKFIGNKGEALAARFLEDEKHYKILERNYRYGHGEVDLIALDDPVVIFVEVRTRKDKALVSGYFSVSNKKKAALRPVCFHYIDTFKIQFFRFDIVEIAYDSEQFELFHYENVSFF